MLRFMFAFFVHVCSSVANSKMFRGDSTNHSFFFYQNCINTFLWTNILTVNIWAVNTEFKYLPAPISKQMYEKNHIYEHIFLVVKNRQPDHPKWLVDNCLSWGGSYANTIPSLINDKKKKKTISREKYDSPVGAINHIFRLLYNYCYIIYKNNFIVMKITYML